MQHPEVVFSPGENGKEMTKRACTSEGDTVFCEREAFLLSGRTVIEYFIFEREVGEKVRGL